MSQNSLRTCVGCKKVVSPDQLVRVAVEHTQHGPEAVLDVPRRIGGSEDPTTLQLFTEKTGIDVTYTDRMADVNAENLGHHLNVLLSTRWNGQKESESEDHGKPMSAKR